MLSFNKFFCLFAFWVGLYGFGFSQTITLSGYVRDVDTEEPIPFCNVYIEGTKIGIATDIDGFYQLIVDATVDSLVVSAVGYETQRKAISQEIEQLINFKLTSTTQSLKEVVFLAGENPANRIVRAIIENKKNNRIEAVASYQCERYSKLEIDLENLPDSWKDKKLLKPFDFIFENVDTLSDERPFLPIYLNESLADIYYVQSENKAKPVVKAQKISVNETNKSFTEFIKQIEGEYSYYDNWIYILDKAFVSPFANAGLFYYEYYIIDSTYIEGKWSYKLKFKPKRKQEPTFYGDFWVADTTFAIQRLNMRMSPDVNINLVKRIIVYQESQLQDNRWLPYKEKLIVDFKPTKEDATGFIGRSTSTYKDFKINEKETETYYEVSTANYNFEEVKQDDPAFWEQVRHEPLTSTEAKIYPMIDSIMNVPIYKTYIDILYTVFIGYKDLGLVEIGPYSSIFSLNPVEGKRFRMGINTRPEWSKIYYLGGYLAYGTRDERLKYGADLKWNINTHLRTQLGVSYRKDISLNSESSESFQESNFFTGLFRRPILQKLIAVEEGKIYYEKFWNQSLSNRFVLLHRNLDPYGGIFEDGRGFNFGYLPDPENPSRIDTTISTTEFIIRTRFAPGERFLESYFNRTSLGSPRPIIELQYAVGFQAFGSDYNYHKLALSYQHYFYINPLGWLSYKAKIGKTFGTLPFLLLDVHPGNEGLFYDGNAFNTMNRYEFASDTYASLMLEHHFEGLLLNKIPLLRKLQFREVATLKAVVGYMSDANKQANQLNAFQVSEENTYTGFVTPSTKPYLEAGIGIENILKIFRIETLWRLNYLDNPQAKRFNLRLGVNFYF